MSKSTINGPLADEVGPERVFVGIPDFTPEGAEVRVKEAEIHIHDMEVGARIQSLTAARDIDPDRFAKDLDRDAHVADLIATAATFEAYLLFGIVPTGI